MTLMLPSLTQHGKPHRRKAPVHSHTDVPGGTWHMEITSPTFEGSKADGLTAARSQLQKAAAVQKHRLLRVSSTTWHVPRIVAVNVYGLCERIDVVELAGFDQRSDGGAVPGAAAEPAKGAFFRSRVIGRTVRASKCVPQ